MLNWMLGVSCEVRPSDLMDGPLLRDVEDHTRYEV
jgi:hypothetical protein